MRYTSTIANKIPLIIFIQSTIPGLSWPVFCKRFCINELVQISWMDWVNCVHFYIFGTLIHFLIDFGLLWTLDEIETAITTHKIKVVFISFSRTWLFMREAMDMHLSCLNFKNLFQQKADRHLNLYAIFKAAIYYYIYLWRSVKIYAFSFMTMHSVAYHFKGVLKAFEYPF